MINLNSSPVLTTCFFLICGQAWYMVRPWLGQPTREVVRFVQTEPSEQLPEQPRSSDGADTQKFWLLHPWDTCRKREPTWNQLKGPTWETMFCKSLNEALILACSISAYSCEDWSGLDWCRQVRQVVRTAGVPPRPSTRHLSPCKLPPGVQFVFCQFCCVGCTAFAAFCRRRRLFCDFFAVYRYITITYIHPYPSHPRHTLVKESRVGVWWDISRRLRFWHSEVDAEAWHGHAWPVNWTTIRFWMLNLSVFLIDPLESVEARSRHTGKLCN